MDERFPKYLRILVRKLEFLALPNLSMLISALAVLGFIGKNFLGAPMERFVFDPTKVLAGEWWRLFSFPVSEGIDNPLLFIFYVLYIYFVMGGLENSWGPGPLTVFTLMSYLSALIAAFVTGQPISIWYYVLTNVSLAFGTLFPDVEFYIFFVLPVKAKWLAMLAGGLIVLAFLTGSLWTKVLLLIVHFPYLLFFGPMLYRWANNRWRVNRNRKRFDDDIN